MMKDRSCRRSRKSVVMPPTLRYSSSSSAASKAKKRPGTRMRMRAWLEDLLNKGACQGLSWKDRSKNIFTIEWRHASSHGFDQSVHGDVFSKWAQHTGKITTNFPGNHSSNKSNFRCALHSLKDCIELTGKGDKKGEKAKRTFQFIDVNHPQFNKKRKQSALKKSSKVDEDSEGSSSDAMSMKHEEDLSLPSFEGNPDSLAPSVALPANSSMQALFSGEQLTLSGSPMNTRSHGMSPISGTSESKPSVPRLTSHNSHSHFGGSTLTHSEPHIPRSHVPDLETLLDTSSNHTSHQRWNVQPGSSTATSPQIVFTTETSPDGITTIVLQPTTSSFPYVSSPSVAPREITAIKQEPNQDFPSVETKDKTYEPLGSHLNNKLNCGGQVKIMVQKQETLQLQLPEFQIKELTQPSSQTTLDESELDLASTMEVQADEDSFVQVDLYYGAIDPEAFGSYDNTDYEEPNCVYTGMDSSMSEIPVSDMETVVETEPSGQFIQLRCANAVSDFGKTDPNK
ncbi:unnamed protein product [Lymnaea stagnalis]|uniref:IRF tryptophan pentad repeat domain-containing protein n=1 Tax=Lymnaea stagnalis TaxID=6523 RepID=A0AAV2H9P2_LYMST